MKHYNVMPTLTVLGVALLVVGALKAEDVSESFEGDTLGQRPVNDKWSGNCAVSNNVGSYSLATPGTPISGDHVKMLSIEGGATRSYTGAESGDRVIDLLVMADEMPDEDLPDGSGDEQIKFAFDTNGCINLYHKLADGSASAQWSKLSDKVYSNGTWVRVSFGFDYANHRCQLKVDGSPLVSSVGYRAASGTEQPGSWYCLASNATALAAIDFVGCGGVDDVVNASSATYTASTGETTATNGVDYAWFDKNGMAWCDPVTTDAPGGSGYTVREAFDTGIDPYSANKLYITNVSYTSTQMVLTFNGCGKTYRVEWSNSPVGAGEEVTGTFISNIEDNVTTWTGSLPGGSGVTYYRVVNTSASTAETINRFAIERIYSTNVNTLVSLPWRSLGPSTNSPMPVTAANVVMTNNLVNGDYLLYYDANAGKPGYKGWCLANGVWTPVSQATVNGLSVTEPAENVVLERGQAIWVIRGGGNRDLTDSYFYLYGQYDSSPVETLVPTNGALLANPVGIGTGGDIFTVSDEKISNAAIGDEIRVPLGDNELPKVIRKFSDGWKTKVPYTSTIQGPPGADSIVVGSNNWEAVNLNVPAGQGFMYIRKSKSSTDPAPTVNW